MPAGDDEMHEVGMRERIEQRFEQRLAELQNEPTAGQTMQAE
jgi:hypothetical protein